MSLFCRYSVAQSCSTLCDPTNCSTPAFPVLHSLPEFAQTHVYWAGDASQPSYPLLSPSPAFNLSQHEGLFQWISSLHQRGGQSIGPSASVLPMNIQGWFPLGLTGLISFLSKGLSRVFSSTTIWKHQIFNIFMKQKTKQTKPKTKDILIKDETRENYFEHEIYISKKK